MNQIKFQFHRQLGYNNWDCPILDYSSIYDSDYSSSKFFCGKYHFRKKMKIKDEIKLIKLDEYCPDDKCLSGQTCSMRLNEDLSYLYSCCELGYAGENCETGLILFLLFNTI